MQVLLSFPMSGLLRYPLQNMTYKPIVSQEGYSFKNDMYPFKGRNGVSEYLNETTEKMLRFTFKIENNEKNQLIQKLISNIERNVESNDENNNYKVTNYCVKKSKPVSKIYYLLYLGIGSLIAIVKIYTSLH